MSANGTSDGIAWALATSNQLESPAVLYAYDAANLSDELYNSSQVASRDQAGLAVRFMPPVVANGKVFIATDGEVDVYGLFHPPPAPAPDLSMLSATITMGGQSVSVSYSITGAALTSTGTIDFYWASGPEPTDEIGTPFGVQTDQNIGSYSTTVAIASLGDRPASALHSGDRGLPGRGCESRLCLGFGVLGTAPRSGLGAHANGPDRGSPSGDSGPAGELDRNREESFPRASRPLVRRSSWTGKSSWERSISVTARRGLRPRACMPAETPSLSSIYLPRHFVPVRRPS